jgi:hypothetical protein
MLRQPAPLVSNANAPKPTCGEASFDHLVGAQLHVPSPV